jgi:hypothetical protein
MIFTPWQSLLLRSTLYLSLTDPGDLPREAQLRPTKTTNSIDE